MATIIVRESAKIYEFPVRNIQRLKDPREGRPRPLIYDSCGSWYHEDAIREEEEARKQ